MSSARVLVARHGETDWSAAGKHTSRTDLPLNARGREQAAALGRALRDCAPALVLCSPLRRARETCEIAGFGASAVIDDRLREWDYGDYEGRTTPEIRTERPDWSLWRDGCPGGEQPAQVGARADAVIERARSAGGDVLVFAHGHVLRVLTARWLGFEPAAGERFALAAGATGVLGHERETQVLQRWNMPH
jgi:broad specificity phosphatase PhoE